MISDIEKGKFLKLFNRGGYVLDFSTNGFDVFTMASVGVPLCQRYQASKGQSLTAFLYDTSDAQAFKLLSDLLEYYEENYRPEFDDAEALPYSSGRYDRSNKGTYLRCREIIDREKAHSTPFAETAEYLKGKFSSEYLDKQIDLLSRMRTENPTEAIGKSKELIESCCKTILEEQGVTVEKSWDVSRLISETEKLLHISAKQVDENAPAAKHVKKLLGSLHGVAVGVAEFRNEFGSGHGKSASFRAAPVRHAKLAVGCSLTLCEYLWETYEWRIETGSLSRG